METSQNPADSASWGLKVADLMDSILRIGPTLSLQVSFISCVPSTWTILSWHRLLLSSTLLREVLTRLESAGLSDKLEKCQFCRSELTFLGYKVTSEGILPNEGKVGAVADFNTPTCVKQVRQFLGPTRFYRRFIHDYACHAEPLNFLTFHFLYLSMWMYAMLDSVPPSCRETTTADML